MATPLQILKDHAGAPTYWLSPPDDILSATLATGVTNVTLNYPDPILGISINYSDTTDDVWVAANGQDAAPPAGASFAVSSSQLKVAGFRVINPVGGKKISFYTAGTGISVSIGIYAAT